MAGGRTLALTTLALLAAVTLGCANPGKDNGPTSGPFGAMPAASQTSSPYQNPAAIASAAAKEMRKNGASFSEKLLGAMPKVGPRSSQDQLARDDPTSLSHQPGKIGADLYIAAARLEEKQGKLDGAMLQYRRALQVDGRNRSALIGLGRLQHRSGDMQAAIATYRQALDVYRNDPVILNDLGLCYARNGDLEQAISVLRSATQAAPDREMYRNNLAAALVEANRQGEAVAYLTQTYGPAVANYNVGYLLTRAGRNDQASQYLTRALEMDPKMQQARTLLDRVVPQISARPQRANLRPPSVAEANAARDYQPLRTPATDLPRPAGDIPSAAPPQEQPEHLRNPPRRWGPFGFLPLRRQATHAVVSFEQELDPVDADGRLESKHPTSNGLRLPAAGARANADGALVAPLPVR